MDVIELNNDTFTKDILDRTTFFQIASPGAQGEPGEILFLTEDGKLYYANYVFGGGLDLKIVESAFPVLAECRFYDSVVPQGWNYMYLLGGIICSFGKITMRDLKRWLQTSTVRLMCIWNGLGLR